MFTFMLCVLFADLCSLASVFNKKDYKAELLEGWHGAVLNIINLCLSRL